MIDQHFTPPLLASILVDSLPTAFEPSCIADFAVGEGSLIYAALKKWPRGLNIVANDLSVNTLNLLNNDWYKSNVDFLNTEAIAKSELKKFENKIDLILLNPPFSQRGIKPILWENKDVKIKSGVALNFIYNSLNFLKSGGFLVAVVPNGCLTSQRDEKALTYLKENYKFKIIAHNREATFEKVRVKTSIIMIENVKPDNYQIDNIKSSSDRLNSRVFRGKFQMHMASINSLENGYPLVHTSSLKNNTIDFLNCFKVANKNSIVRGPAILFPRVGNFNKEKICILSSELEIVISDCIFAVKCKNLAEAECLKEAIYLYWDDFKNNYSGTGAVYSSLDRIDCFINTLYLNKSAQLKEIAA
ncbi:methyltransferase [Acinetobacter soli]|uniref:methyltransferase n=1 Tax=Acinetobacter soli TaxID=487316 RepID=UPI0031BABB48